MWEQSTTKQLRNVLALWHNWILYVDYNVKLNEHVVYTGLEFMIDQYSFMLIITSSGKMNVEIAPLAQ